jgi:hypothetical protein
VDGRVYVYPETLPSQWPAATKVIRVDVGSLTASPFRTNPIRYRLLPGSGNWQLSRDGSLEFRNLREDDYVLQVSFAGNEPAPVASYPVRIGAGSSWLSRSWWIVLILAGAAIAGVVRYAPGLERLRFRIEKSVFLLRRRLSRGDVPSSGNSYREARDHSGDTLLGRYLLGRVVSRGGFSVVYEARDLRYGDARLAVKVLNQNPSEEGWVRDRFAHEVAALRSVEHPGVVPILDSWISTAGEPCLAMPFLEGQTLREAMEEKPFDPARAARVIAQIGSALAEVHGRGVVHRDLKPENLILLDPGMAEEQVVIIDFGTAGLRTAENELAATTLMSGSFHYMAPERLTGRYSPASDVFSLGVIILEMLTGKRLANLRAVYCETAFQDELAVVLRARLNVDAATRVGELLAPAYDPDPRRRPAEVRAWARQIAQAVAGGC